MIAEELPLAGALSAVDAAWQSCCAEAERRGVTGAALSWEVRRDLLREDLLETVRRDPVFASTTGARWAWSGASGSLTAGRWSSSWTVSGECASPAASTASTPRRPAPA